MKRILLLMLTLFCVRAYAQAPVITAIYPVTATPGQTVVISGYYFNDTAANVTVYFGNVKGTVLTATFTQITVTVPFGASIAPIGVTVHHLNGISKLNFTPTFAGNSQPLSASNFSTPVRIPYGAKNSMFLGDIDNDGKLDIVTMSGSSFANIQVYRNINTPGQPVTSASFTSAYTIVPAHSNSYISQLIDFDGDGKLDIIYNDLYYYTHILYNTSTPGAISFSSTSNSIYTLFQNTSVADIDGDGRLDIVWGDHPAPIGHYTINIYQNYSYACTSSSGWCFNMSAARAIRTNMTGQVGSFLLRDITGDNKPELFFNHLNPGSSISDTSILFQNALYTPSTIDSSTFPTSVIYKDVIGWGTSYIIDFDGDGQLDWLKFSNPMYTSLTSSLVFYKNNGSGSTINSSFFSTPYIDSTVKPYVLNNIDIADLNGDGKPDIAGSITSGYHGIHAVTNLTGSGAYLSSTFVDSNIVPIVSGSPYTLFAIGDLDQDSRPDIVYSYNDTAIYVLRNITPIVKPTTQASGLTISSIFTTSMTVSWTNGNGSGRIVLAKPVTTITDTPTSYSSYTASSIFGSGSLIGTTARVVYMGSGTGTNGSVTVTGLTSGVLYRFAIFEYNGPITAMNFLTTSPTTGSATTLPVILTSFTAQKQNNDVLLKWQTASELNNDYFEVERSIDNSKWTIVGKVKGNGTSNEVNSYQFTDEMLKQVQHDGTIYYRLNQVDFDGKSTLSDIRVVNLNQVNTDWNIYPNPATNELFINTSLLQNSTEVFIEVYDLKGSKIYSSIENSSTPIKLNLSTFDVGMYFMKINNKAFKFIKTTN